MAEFPHLDFVSSTTLESHLSNRDVVPLWCRPCASMALDKTPQEVRLLYPYLRSITCPAATTHRSACVNPIHDLPVCRSSEATSPANRLRLHRASRQAVPPAYI